MSAQGRGIASIWRRFAVTHGRGLGGGEWGEVGGESFKSCVGSVEVMGEAICVYR